MYVFGGEPLSQEQVDRQNLEADELNHTRFRVLDELDEEQAATLVKLFSSMATSTEPRYSLHFYIGYLRSRLQLAGVCAVCLKNHEHELTGDPGVPQAAKPKPKCPKCGSTDTETRSNGEQTCMVCLYAWGFSDGPA